MFLDADDDVAEGLECFRANHRHMAVVRDADGKVLGLITLEDILEEIVGEIEDQHDRQGRSRSEGARTAPAAEPRKLATSRQPEPEIKPSEDGR